MELFAADGHDAGGCERVTGKSGMRPTARVYFWRNKGDEFAGGKVHAKVAVCDEELCFVSSANLTGYAMDRNMEAGVLIQGGTLPRTLHRHLEALVTIKIVQG